MTFYPKKIQDRLDGLTNRETSGEKTAEGRDANFACGSSVRISLDFDPLSRTVRFARAAGNGCGYMVASADVLIEAVSGRALSDFHGLNDGELRSVIEKNLGNIDANRKACVDASLGALHAAFADLRLRQIEEFQGEKALICTCFGVTEETIERNIAARDLQTVDEVTDFCKAGGGCGSCRMLIQEMLDHDQDDRMQS
ncbi:MAG: (2Fe-2S)-binding protein [Pyrinomonadaceae bacterium]